jgi:hypothetical protein
VDPYKGNRRKIPLMDNTFLSSFEGRIRRDGIRSDTFRQDVM